MPTKIDFIGGNTKRCLMAMALPMIAAMFLNMMYNLVDSLWIGNLLGETAYAALTNSTPIILILTSVAMGATNGVSILISQAIGAKDKKKAESLIATSFCVAVTFSLLVTILLEIFLPGILKALNTPAETYDMAYSYIRFRADSEASSKAIYEAYTRWCDDNAQKPMSANRVSSELAQNERLYNIEATNNVHVGGKRVRGFVGIEVVNPLPY